MAKTKTVVLSKGNTKWVCNPATEKERIAHLKSQGFVEEGADVAVEAASATTTDPKKAK